MIKSKRKISIFILLCFTILFFGGCFGSAETQSTQSKTNNTYSNAEFTVELPKAWEIIEKRDFTSDVPGVTEATVVVFRNNVKNETYTASVNVVRNQLLATIANSEYAKMTYNKHKSGLFDFKELKREELKIKIGGNETTTTFLFFEGRETVDKPIIRYMQLYGVKNNFAYIITGAASPLENDVTFQTIESIVKSLQIK